jgi:hypothetical protein
LKAFAAASRRRIEGVLLNPVSCLAAWKKDKNISDGSDPKLEMEVGKGVGERVGMGEWERE